jgi:hypothetical protein
VDVGDCDVADSETHVVTMLPRGTMTLIVVVGDCDGADSGTPGVPPTPIGPMALSSRWGYHNGTPVVVIIPIADAHGQRR